MLKFSDKKSFYSFISPCDYRKQATLSTQPIFCTILLYLHKDKRYNFSQRVATGSPFFIFAVVIPSTRKKETIPVLMLNNASNLSIIIPNLEEVSVPFSIKTEMTEIDSSGSLNHSTTSTTHKIKLSFSVESSPDVTSAVATFPQFQRRKRGEKVIWRRKQAICLPIDAISRKRTFQSQLNLPYNTHCPLQRMMAFFLGRF